jgi:hypothetical protein
MELSDIAKEIKESKENIFLIYAFNATGKTRLSVEYKETARDSKTRFQTGVYYNAFSEDLFIWDNDTKNSEADIKMQVIPSSLNRLHSQISEEAVLEKLRPYNPKYEFSISYIDNDSEKGIEHIRFYLKEGESRTSIKISRGEERIFVWCFFLALFDTEGWADAQNQYIFIDDPVSSLDDHNIFITTFTLLDLIEKYYKERKFIITTHHIGFATILDNLLAKGEKAESFKKHYKLRLLEKEGTAFSLGNPKKDVLLYHLRLLQILDDSIQNNSLEVYHMALLRQVLENISSFLGTGRIKYVLEQIGFSNADRITTLANALTHKNVYYPQMDAMVEDNKQIVKDVYNALMGKYHFIIHNDKIEINDNRK